VEIEKMSFSINRFQGISQEVSTTTQTTKASEANGAGLHANGADINQIVSFGNTHLHHDTSHFGSTLAEQQMISRMCQTFSKLDNTIDSAKAVAKNEFNLEDGTAQNLATQVAVRFA
jgi:hypothetical protein